MAVSVATILLASDRPAADRVSRFVWIDHSPSFFSAPDWPYGLFGTF